jgi:hypothetical protein
MLGGADEVDEGLDENGRAVGPQLAEGAEFAGGKAVEHAFIPTDPTEGVMRMIAEDIGDALDLTEDKGFGVLGKKVDVTDTFRANLLHKFGKC